MNPKRLILQSLILFPLFYGLTLGVIAAVEFEFSTFSVYLDRTLQLGKIQMSNFILSLVLPSPLFFYFWKNRPAKNNFLIFFFSISLFVFLLNSLLYFGDQGAFTGLPAMTSQQVGALGVYLGKQIGTLFLYNTPLLFIYSLIFSKLLNTQK